MGRSIIIPGECMVSVKGNGPLALSGVVAGGQLSQLGLCLDVVSITPKFNHKDINADDFGPNVPPEVMWQLADARISFTLVHFDDFVLDAVIAESMGGGVETLQNLGWAGYMAPAGTMMGNNRTLYTSGNHFVGLNFETPVTEYPWSFPAAYLTGPPVRMPLGVNHQQVLLNFRAIPYQFYPQTNSEIGSSGVPLWTRVLLT